MDIPRRRVSRLRYSESSELRKLALATRPAPDTDYVVAEAAGGRPEVTLRLTRDSKTKQADATKVSVSAGSTTVTTLVSLSAHGAGAEAAVDAFVGEAFRHHAARLKAAEDAAGRYMFAPLPASEKNWKRYKLSDEKTFDTLFFREKAKVLRTLDDFENKTGKYQIAGFPHKLGLLLWGPPGTGKTSLIKAIAAKTRRHVINVRLSQCSTNQRLADWLFDGRFQVDDETIKLKTEECVFVFEDIDCVSDVVLARGGKAEGDDATKAAASGSDRLSLAGLLNVLDGVVDSPGRVVIMTSNHPERLDPALVR